MPDLADTVMEFNRTRIEAETADTDFGDCGCEGCFDIAVAYSVARDTARRALYEALGGRRG